MSARLFLLGVLLTACSTPDFGPAPFTCPELGACPDGYRCAEGVCIGTEAPDPPIFVGQTASNITEPVLVYDGDGYTIFSEQVDDDTHFHTLHLTRYSAGKRKDDQVLATLTRVDGSDIGLDAIFLSVAKAYLAAWSVNNKLGSSLTVRSITSEDNRGSDLSMLTSTTPATVIGFSRPSLSSADGSDAYLAYTFTDPATSTTDTLRCSKFAGVAGTLIESCVPMGAANRFVSEAVIDAADAGTTLFWRDTQYHVSLTRNGQTQAPVGLGREILSVRRSAAKGSFFTLIVQVSTEMRVRWRLALGAVAPTTNDGMIKYSEPIDSIPDVVILDDDLVYCFYDGKTFALQRYKIPTDLTKKESFVQPGALFPMERLSSAPVRSCRLAVGDRDLGIVWQEAAPNDQVRTYFTALSRASLGF